MGAQQVVDRFGFLKGSLILEMGRSKDCDEELRGAISSITGTSLIDGQATDVVDGVILWWRQEDGDLIDELVDAQTYLSEDGQIWLLTPKAGREGHVEPSDIQDDAQVAGLTQTTTFAACTDWTATRLVARKASHKHK